MSNMTSTAHIVDVFLNEGFLQWCGRDYWINDLPAEYPVWPADGDDAPRPLFCLQTEDYVRCPKHPTEYALARVTGVDGKPCGFVRDDCSALYATDSLVLPQQCTAREGLEGMACA